MSRIRALTSFPARLALLALFLGAQWGASPSSAWAISTSSCLVEKLGVALAPSLEGFDPRLGLRSEQIGDDLYLELRGEAFVIDRSKSAASDYRNFRKAFEREFEATPGKFELVQAESHAELMTRIERAGPVLGSNAFDAVSKNRTVQILDEINLLTSERNTRIAAAGRRIKAEHPKLHIQEAKQRARELLEADPEFVSIELELMKRKLRYSEAYQRKLKNLGIDLYSDKKTFEAAVAAVDPFKDSVGVKRFVFRRGETFKLRPFSRSYRDTKYNLHKGDLSGHVSNADEFERRVYAHAESTNPRMISMQGIDSSTNAIRYYKYNPDTQELLVMGEDGVFLSFYRPMPRSPSNPRGHSDPNLTPLQYVIRNAAP